MPKRLLTADELIERRRLLWEQDLGADAIENDRTYRLSVSDYIRRNTEAREQIMNEFDEKPERLIELFFVIVDKNQQTVPFFLNDVQVEFADILNVAIEDFKAGRRNHLKFLLLKGRQQGFTQFITAYQLASCLVRKNFAGFTLADSAENTEVIFTDKAKFPYDNLPEYVKPTQKYNNRRELHFQKPNGRGLNSRMRVSTAGNEDVGRSKTVNFFHGSEVAFWKDLRAILKALGEALTKNCISILETTANGYNSYKALWDDDANNWDKLFFPWWKTREYRLPFESELARVNFLHRIEASSLTDDAQQEEWAYSRCKWLLENGVDIEQAYWYYNKWRDLHEDIKQEYPCSPNEAFMSTGQNYFSIENLTRRLEEVKRLLKEGDHLLAQGYFTYEYGQDPYTKDKIILPETIVWNDSVSGEIKLYAEAEDRVNYTIGGDTASDGSNNNIAQVIDKLGTQHAVLTIAKDEDLFAEQMFCLGWYYNTALISPEINHSTHPTKVLVERGYPNVYIRGGAEAPLDMGQKVLPKYGYRTDQNNRPVMLGELRELVRDHVERINDLETLQEMLTFVKNAKGKPEAEEGENDDRVLAYAIAMQTSTLRDTEQNKPLEELTGYYTESELEDMGYTRYEIQGYVSGKLILYKEGR